MDYIVTHWIQQLNTTRLQKDLDLKTEEIVSGGYLSARVEEALRQAACWDLILELHNITTTTLLGGCTYIECFWSSFEEQFCLFLW